MQWGKEVVSRFASGLASGAELYTDSNGREMQRRQREQGILLLMSPALQGEVVMQSHREMLRGISYFRGASADFILQARQHG